jgi:hypothetical protein
MSDGSSPFDASQSALGYLHQCQYALLLGLQRDEEPNLCISIEKLDDIAFHESPSSADVAKQLLQVKHHISRAGGLGDASPDIWKTIRIWSEAVAKNQIDLEHATLCLLTTTTPTNRNAIRFLSPDPTVRKPEDARTKLEKAGAASTSDTIKQAYNVYIRLNNTQRVKLFEAMFLLDTSLMAVDLQKSIGIAVRHAVQPQHRLAFVERLQGWWYQRVVVHLSAAANQPIPVLAIQQQVHELRGQFQRDCLPDDLFKEQLPPEATPTEDDRTFILQLLLIGLSKHRLRIAQEDHYRAFSQRSRWVKDNLIGMDDLSHFESRLVDSWRLKFLTMKDAIEDGCGDLQLAGHGMNLYQWVETDAPSQSALWVRPQFQSQYMTRGSFHILAELLRVGWHPEYEGRLAATPDESNGETP